MASKFYASVATKLKVRKFWGLIPTTVEVAREKLQRVCFSLLLPIMNRVNGDNETTVQLHSTKLELSFCAGSNPTCGVSEIREGEGL